MWFQPLLLPQCPCPPLASPLMQTRPAPSPDDIMIPELLGSSREPKVLGVLGALWGRGARSLHWRGWTHQQATGNKEHACVHTCWIRAVRCVRSGTNRLLTADC